jgi:hypothetical protein
MGSQSKYKSRELVYVPVKIVPPAEGAQGAGVELKYVFPTNIPLDDRTKLGQIAVDKTFQSAPPPGTIMGASFPRPGRANKREALRFTSSFYDFNKALALKKDQWRLTKFKGVPRAIFSEKAFVRTVYVTINGVYYAWNQPKVTQTNITTAIVTQLGVKLATPADLDNLVTGCNYPKPPRASTTIVTQDDVKVVSSYYDPSISALPENWSPVKRGVLSIV